MSCGDFYCGRICLCSHVLLVDNYLHLTYVIQRQCITVASIGVVVIVVVVVTARTDKHVCGYCRVHCDDDSLYISYNLYGHSSVCCCCYIEYYEGSFTYLLVCEFA